MPINVQRLKELVIERGISYTELSKKSNISKTQISRIINSDGTKKVRPTTIKLLADSLKVNYKELWKDGE